MNVVRQLWAWLRRPPPVRRAVRSLPAYAAELLEDRCLLAAAPRPALAESPAETFQVRLLASAPVTVAAEPNANVVAPVIAIKPENGVTERLPPKGDPLLTAMAPPPALRATDSQDGPAPAPEAASAGSDPNSSAGTTTEAPPPRVSEGETEFRGHPFPNRVWEREGIRSRLVRLLLLVPKLLFGNAHPRNSCFGEGVPTATVHGGSGPLPAPLFSAASRQAGWPSRGNRANAAGNRTAFPHSLPSLLFGGSSLVPKLCLGTWGSRNSVSASERGRNGQGLGTSPSPAAQPAGAFKLPTALGWTELGLLAAQALYLGTLRAAETGPPTGPAAPELPGDTRLLVADLVQRTTEVFSRLIRGFFKTFLGRLPVEGEEAGWVAMLLRGQTEEEVLAAFLGTEEFGQRALTLVAAATPDESYVQALHTLLLQRAAADAELSGWVTALPQLGRAGVARLLLGSTEYRRLQVAALFAQRAGRPGDEAEVAAWAAAPFSLRDIRQVFETRPEWFRGTARDFAAFDESSISNAAEKKGSPRPGPPAAATSP